MKVEASARVMAVNCQGEFQHQNDTFWSTYNSDHTAAIKIIVAKPFLLATL